MPRKSKYEFDEERVKIFLSLSAEEKLNHIQKMNEFINIITPKRSRKIWTDLKKRGW